MLHLAINAILLRCRTIIGSLLPQVAAESTLLHAEALVAGSADQCHWPRQQNFGSRAGRGLVDAQQCLGLVPGDVLTARIFLQGLVGVRPRPEPREVFLRVQHLHLQIKPMPNMTLAISALVRCLYSKSSPSSAGATHEISLA